MKYPALGLFTLFLRALAETTDKLNSGELEKGASWGNAPMAPVPPVEGEPTADKPKRTRRTAAQIAADEAAEKEAAQQQQGTASADTPAKEDPKAPAQPTGQLYPDKTDEDLYQERRASFKDYIEKGGSAELERVKATAAKYNPSQGNRGISREDHAAFLADIEALKL